MPPLKEAFLLDPDGMNEKLGTDKGYWLVPNDEFIRRYNEELNAMGMFLAGTYGPCDLLAIHIKFEGVLSTPAANGSGYGYMKLYEREVNVTRVLEIKYIWVTTDDSCLSAISTRAAQTVTPPIPPTATTAP